MAGIIPGIGKTLLFMKTPREPDPHFGTDEKMLAWCKSENITPRKDSKGEWDWHAAWAEYSKRLDGDDKPGTDPLGRR